MKRAAWLRLDLAQLRLLREVLGDARDSGVYWGNRPHFAARLARTTAAVDDALAWFAPATEEGGPA